MKSFPCLALLTLFLSADADAIILTGFGTGEFTLDGSTTWTTTQTATNLSLSGSDLGDSVAGYISDADISGLPELQLTATFSINPNSGFSLILFDASFNTRSYSGNLSEFGVGQPATVTLSSYIDSGFDPTTVIGLALNSGGPPPGAAIDFSLDQLAATAAPEPATAILLVLGILGLVARRCSNI